MKFSFYFLTLNVEIFSFRPFKSRFISFKGLIDDKWFLLQKGYFSDTFLFKYPFKLHKTSTVYKAITELQKTEYRLFIRHNALYGHQSL
jgi:hypothetical protein